jgi:serine/threonine protein phosphatase PrpC
MRPYPQEKNLSTRPLEPPKDFSSTSRRIRYGWSTDTGKVRTNNQDAVFTMLTSIDSKTKMPPLGLFIVADGMGGHTDGEIASEVAVQTIAQQVIDDVLRHQMTNKPQTSESRTIPEVLSTAMGVANDAVQLKVPSGGTTATAVVLRGDLAYFSHVGDSRAYLITEGDNVEVITRDHSLVKRLQELNQITEEEAEIHPQKNVLYRALGQNTSLESDAATRRLPPGSKLMMCSDGLWGQVPEGDMLSILRSSSSPQEAADRLVSAANDNGGPDNITVVIIQMPE